MKSIFVSAILLLSVSLLPAQLPNPKYDATLAEELGADDYGMKQYILVILKTGTNKDEGQERTESFNGHMKNMTKLVEENKLIVAGPIQENDNQYRGLFILDVSTLEEADKLLQTDPVIANDYLAYDLYNWYGSAALPVYLEASEKVGKFGF